MKLSTQGIESFLLVVELGSVSAAARRLGVAKSVVSKRLSELESSIGVSDHHVHAVYPRRSLGSVKVKGFMEYLQQAMAVPPWGKGSHASSPSAPRRDAVRALSVAPRTRFAE